MRFQFSPVRMAKMKRDIQDNKLREGLGKEEASFTPGRISNLFKHCGNQCVAFSQKAKHRFTIWQSYSTYLACSQKSRHSTTQMLDQPTFMAAFFTTERKWKQFKFCSADHWLMKQWYINTIEFYSAIKRNWNHEISQ